MTTQKTAYVGDTQRFECQVVAFPSPNITWFKDNINITNNPRYNIGYNAENGTITLMLHNVTPADEGLYVCRAENSEGHAITSANLVVKVERAKGFGKEYSAMTTEKLSEEEISQVEIIKSGRQTIIEEVITRIEESEKEVIEEKHIAPKIDYELEQENIQLKMNSSLYIEVDYSGIPKPKITWFHGDKEIEESARVTVEDNQGWCYLKKKNVKCTDAGVYRVTAENVAGFDQAEFGVTVQGIPSAPRKLRVTEVNKDYIIIAWEEPEHDGGDDITEYLIEKSLAGGMFINCGRTPHGTNTFKVCKLFEGNEYMFRVVAVNRVGEGEPVTSSTPVKARLPFDPPQAPEDLQVAEYNADYLTVTWKPPKSDGGSALTQYIIEKKDVTRKTGMWVLAGTVGPSELKYKVSKLFTGNAYNIRVYAENRVGVSEPVELQHPVTAKLPYDKPDAPENLRHVETGRDFITLRWDPPKTDGGTPITGYIVEKRDAKRGDYIYLTELPPDVTTYRVSRLFEGCDYLFRVIAENQVGSGEPANTRHPITAKLPYEEPMSPRNLVVTSQWSDHMVLHWEAPEHDGGKPITDYVIERRDAQRSNWIKTGTTSAHELTFKAENLFEGTDYFFRVFAENCVGLSLTAAELQQSYKAKIPFDTPGAPKNLRVVDYNTDFVTVAWDASSRDGGSPITRYIVERRDNIVTMWTQAGVVDASTLTLKVDKLFEGQLYYFRVAAENQAGRGAHDELSKPAIAALPYGRPSCPRDVRVTDVWKDYMTVSWSAPEKDGGSPVTGYNIEQRDAYEGSFRFLCSVDSKTCNYQATNLVEGHEYYYRIYAQNAAGLSDRPGEITPPVKARVPFDPPASARNLRVTDRSPGRIAVEWDAALTKDGSDVSSYIIQERHARSMNYNTVARVGADTLSYDVTGLDENSDYYIRVFSENAAGLSKSASELNRPVAANTPIKPPSAPHNLRACDINRTSIVLEWDTPKDTGNSDVTGYMLESRRCDKNGTALSDYQLVGFSDPPDSRYKILALKEGDWYQFRVRAQNKAGDGDYCELDKAVQARRPYDAPSAPTDLHMTSATQNTLNVQWLAPSSDGGSAITAYTVLAKSPRDHDYQLLKMLDADQTSYTLYRLEADCEYMVRICAENEAGASVPAETATPFKTQPAVNIPSKPEGITVDDISSDHVTLSWKQPLSDGGAPVLYYDVKQQKSGDVGFDQVCRVDAGKTRCVVHGLCDGTAYLFSVAAINETGESDAMVMGETVTTKSAIKLPASPRKLKISNITPESVTLTWKPPKCDEPITNYVISKQQIDVDEEMCAVSEVPSDVLECIVSGLAEKTEYKFAVQAKNEAGLSETPAFTDKPITTRTKIKPPEAPKKMKVSDVTPESVKLTWKPTKSNDPVTHYVVSKQRVGTDRELCAVYEVPGDVLECLVVDLTEDTQYQFAVHAKNEAGLSETPLLIDKPITTKSRIRIPQAPKKIKVSDITPESVKLTWKPTKSEDSVTHYVVSKQIFGTDGELSVVCEVPGDVLECVVGDLTDDTQYQFAVHAKNEAGLSETPLLVDKPVTTKSRIRIPQAPKKIKVSDITPDSVKLTWKPTKSEDLITHYVVSKQKVGTDGELSAVCEVPGDVLECVVGDLTDDTQYQFSVHAKNEAGLSESPALTDKPVTTKPRIKLPVAPSKLKVSDITPESVTVSWKPPKSDDSITHYVVSKQQLGVDLEMCRVSEIPAEVLQCVVSGLTEDTKYQFAVHAKNEAGLSDTPVLTHEPVTTHHRLKEPTAPVELVAAAVTTDSVTLSWKAAEDTTPVAYYVVTKQQVGVDSKISTVSEIPAGVLKYTINDLFEDTQYLFAVYAKNEAGMSKYPVTTEEPIKTRRAAKVPGAPRDLVASSVESGHIKLSWREPEHEAALASPPQYVIEQQQDGGTWSGVKAADSPATSAVVTGLAASTSYLFRVYAQNEIGRSHECAQLNSPVFTAYEPETAEKMQTSPGAPRDLEILISDDDVSVRWNTPEHDGGTPVTQYIIVCREESKQKFKKCAKTSADVTSCSLRSVLKQGVAYFLRVYAKNEVGISDDAAETTELVRLPSNQDKIKEKAEKEKKDKKKDISEPKAKEEIDKVDRPQDAYKASPSAPRDLELVGVTQTGVTLKWKAPMSSDDTECFVIVMRTAEKKKFKKVAKTEIMEVTISEKLKPAQQYFFRVYAQTKEGISEEYAELPFGVTIPETKDEVDAATETVVEAIPEEALSHDTAPQFTQPPQDVAVDEGGVIQITCKVTADPDATVTYIKDGKKLKPKKKDKRIVTDWDVSTDIYSLTISDCTLEDAGTYKIKAENSRGYTEESIGVTVKPKHFKPSVSNLPKSVNVQEGEDLKLTIQVTGSPAPSVVLTREGVTVDSSSIRCTNDIYDITVAGLSRKDSCTYTVTASNVAGTLSKQVKVKVSEKHHAPKIERPSSAVQVKEGEEICLSFTSSGVPEPDACWFKDDKEVTVNNAVQLSSEKLNHSLRIPSSTAADSGEYMLTLTNTAGSDSCSVTVTVTEKSEGERDAELLEQLTPQIQAEKAQLSQADDMLFKQYPMLESYRDEDKSVSLDKGDIVEVLDTEIPTKWLVRHAEHKDSVCYVPVEYLLGIREESEELKEKEYDVYEALTNYKTTETDGLSLLEAEQVEVLDSASSNKWLCQKRNDKNNQGWVPPSYLTPYKGEQLVDKRRTQEQFREDVLKIQDKDKEAVMKRRYALKDLWESEQQYVKDLQFALDNYYPYFQSTDLPSQLQDHTDTVFSTLPDIAAFHQGSLLPLLLKCSTSPDDIADIFLRQRDQFYHEYLPYFSDREDSDKLLSLSTVRGFLQNLFDEVSRKQGTEKHDRTIGNVGEKVWSLPQYLGRPWQRIGEYVAVLQDLIKYSLQAGDGVVKLEEAIEMLLELKRSAKDSALVKRVDGYPNDLAALGDVIRHGDFIVWEGEAVGKGNERHLILFKDNLLITKRIKPICPTSLSRYQYMHHISLSSDYALNEECDNTKRFEIWTGVGLFDPFTFQAHSVPLKKIWCDMLRKQLSKYNPGTVPEFTTELEEITVDEGDSAAFVCKIKGDPKPEISWTCDGKTVSNGKMYKTAEEADTYTLSICECKQETNGRYRVTATNKVGAAHSSASLIVCPTELPSFSNGLKSASVLLGDDATFRVNVSARPLPTVKWYKNGMEIEATERIEVRSRDDAYSLVIRNVEEQDLATYKVIAKNKAGNIESEGELVITDLEEKMRSCAAEFVSVMSDVTINEGNSLELSCRIKGYPTPEVSWYHMGEKLHSEGNYALLFNGTVATCHMAYVHPENEGTYTCKIKNSQGQAECSAKLSVAVKPKFSSRFTDIELFRGEKAELICHVTGSPTPDVTWYHEKHILTESERLKIYREGHFSRLLISSAIKSDVGEYTCVASNQAGQVSCTANIFVSEDIVGPKLEKEVVGFAPSFTKKMSNIEVIADQTAKFLVKCIGEPAPTVKWLRKGREVELSDRVKKENDGMVHSLVFDNVREEDAGFYACYVSNSTGEDKCSAELIVETQIKESPKRRDSLQQFVAPIMPMEKPKLKELDENFVQLSWPCAILPKYAQQTYIRYIVERKDLSDTTSDWTTVRKDIGITSFKYKDYDITRDYLYRIRASNEYGDSDPSMVASYYGKTVAKKHPVIEIPKEKRAPKAPRDKPAISEVTDDSLRLSWHAADIPDFAEQTEILYILERRCPPSKNWIEIVSDIKELTYIMKGYKCEKDYMFRVRASNEYGISEPSMSSTLFAKPADIGLLDRRKSIDSQKARVKPRTVWEKPEINDVTEKTCVLSWKPSSIPDYASQVPIWYIVEQRIPPNLEWTRIDAECKETSYKARIHRSKDYYWRVRAANEYGQAEPSMPAMLRKKQEVDEIDMDTQRRRRSWSRESTPGSRGVPLHLRIPAEFISRPDDKQYGVETQTSRITTSIRGYPEPKITWYFQGSPLAMNDKFSSSLTSAGELSLEIARFDWDDVGLYEVKITNDFGSATQQVEMDMADPPTFLEPLKDQVFHLRQNGKLECRVHGIPYPTVQFKHDWRVVADSHRVKILREDADHWTLNVHNAIHLDEGLYECVAENVAGKVYCTACVKVTEKPGLYRDVKFNQVAIEDYFHVIDELSRGSYGVVRRVIDKNSGTQYAAKFLRYGDIAVKEELETELSMMSFLDHTNIVQVVDGYEDKKRLIIVMEIVTGGELLQRILREDALTESEAAFYIRQLLLAVEYMHSRNVLHLDLKPENLFLLSPSSDELKVIDFGYARRYNPSKNIHAKYATPEFAAPEVARDEVITPAADMWSVGVITYIILGGISPFHAETPRETLLKVMDGNFAFDEKAFSHVSEQAKDFISKLLTKDPRKRLSASKALEHNFIDMANHRGLGNRIPIDNLRGYIFRRKCERGVNLVQTVVQPRPLSALIEGKAPCSDDVEFDVPVLRLPEYEETTSHSSVEAGAAAMLQVMGPPSLASGAPSEVGSQSLGSEWGRAYEDENTWYDFSSAYQAGPDTHLMPTRDSDLSLRMASYRRQTTSPLKGERPSLGLRERRDLRDLDREGEDEYGRMDRGETSARLRSKPAVWYLRAIAEDDSMQDTGFPPIFKEKIVDSAYNVGDSCTLKVYLIANPRPTVNWYRNDELLTDGGRVRTSQSEDGYYGLTVLSTKPHDFGVYKCVARNKYGTVTCRARMLLGDHPSRPGRPHITKVSDREVFMIWEEPEHDGNSYIQSYRVDWHKPGDERWTTATYCIDECALIKGLKPDTLYRFRVCAVNHFGISPYSWASVEIKTQRRGCEELDIDTETKRILLRSRQATNRPSPERTPLTSTYGSEENLCLAADKKAEFAIFDRDIHLQEIDPETFLEFGSEVWRGRYTLIRDLKLASGKSSRLVAKLSLCRDLSDKESLREYDALKSLKQQNIVRMYEAYIHNQILVLVLEKLYGENVVRTLSLKNKYNEQQVSHIIKQVLDALQYLHHRGIIHLNVQPDNVVMQSRRRLDVKLIDFGRARKITTTEGVRGDKQGTVEFMAPEKVKEELIGVAADVWGVGLLAFILLSGVSPFRGLTENDTCANITQVRYDPHALYHNVTKYSLKFLYQILKRSPKSRLSLEECLEHRWLMLNQPMVKTRRAAIFPTDKLKIFEEQYQKMRKQCAPPEKLISAYGTALDFSSD